MDTQQERRGNRLYAEHRSKRAQTGPWQKHRRSASSIDDRTKVRCQYNEHWDDIFKTIITDNGSEFSLLSGLEDLRKTLLYFAYPYTSCKKGSVERHNSLIHRFIPKSRRIDSYSDEALSATLTACSP